jgi:hypothetical protein
MDEGVKGMIIFGVVLTASVGWLIFQRIGKRGFKGDLRPTDPDPRAQQLVTALKGGNVQPLFAFLQQLGEDWDARAYYLDNLLVHMKREVLDQVCATSPSPLAFLVRGAHCIHWAWEARGRGRSDQVSPQAWALFEQRLAWAKNDLFMAAQGDPRDPTPHAKLLTIAKAESVPDDEAYRIFQQVIARQPDHYLGHMTMVSLLSERWGGSHDKALQFARQRAAGAPPGSDLPMIVVEAYLDVWSYIVVFDGNSAGALTYLMQPHVRQEITAAYERSLGAGCRVRASTVCYRNTAALAFHLLQDPQKVRREFDQIGQHFTEYPWVYLALEGESTKDAVMRARAMVGLR